MDELGRALRALALEACADVVGPSPMALRRRGRRRVATRVAGGVALVTLGAALAAPAWSDRHEGLIGPPVGPAVTPGPGPSGNPPFPLGSLVAEDARWDASVFLVDGVTAAQRAAVLARLDGLGTVVEVRPESKAEAFARFKQQFRDNPQAIAHITADAMPESLRIVLRGGSDDYAGLVARVCPGAVDPDGEAPAVTLHCMRGVDAVLDSAQGRTEYLGGRSWTGRADVAVVLTMEVTQAQRSAILDRIEAIDTVVQVLHESGEEAERRVLDEEPPGVSIAVPSGRFMPESFRVRLTSPDRFAEFRRRLCAGARADRCPEGVMVVIDQRKVPAP
jgi:hypothetical protein